MILEEMREKIRGEKNSTVVERPWIIVHVLPYRMCHHLTLRMTWWLATIGCWVTPHTLPKDHMHLPHVSVCHTQANYFFNNILHFLKYQKPRWNEKKKPMDASLQEFNFKDNFIILFFKFKWNFKKASRYKLNRFYF